MNKKSKIRSKLVKESLIDYENLTESLKENTKNAVKDLLDEAVRDTYNKLLNESDDEYDEEEVDDTEIEDIDDENTDETSVEAEDTDAEVEDTDAEEEDGEESLDVVDDETEDNGEETTDVEVGDDEVSVETSGTDGEGSEWDEFEKYKVGDDEYDFSEAEDEEIVKVYKLLKDDDQVMVNQSDGKVNIKDNETGAEYIVDLEGDTEASFDDDLEFEVEKDDEMNESIIYEVALNEYDSNVGYTDNYQKKDVMSNPGMSEPGKNVRDWDKGVPKGDEKPWSGYPGKKSKADKPFTAGKGKQVEEEEEIPMEEATNVGGFVQQNSTSKSHVPNSNGRSARSMSKGGKRTKGTVTPRYSGNADGDDVKESIMRKAKKIFRENNELKAALNKFRDVLKEAAVTNVNLGNIIKLISENATSQDEKMEIIERFGKEATTVKSSNNLYESISRQLKKNNKLNINEGNSFENSQSKINETTIYKSPDMLSSLDLMHRLCK